MDRDILFDDPQGQSIYFDEFGTRLHIRGVIYGDGNVDYYIQLPREISASMKRWIYPSVEEWQKFLKFSDNPQLKIEDPKTKMIKAVIGKNFRAIQEWFRWGIYRRDKFQCQYCGATDRPLTIDEYLCQELGGAISEDNCRTACRPCNKAKANKPPEKWEEYRKRRGLIFNG